jgi:hypothetical protein
VSLPPTTHFFNHEPHEQPRKFFIGGVALTEGMAELKKRLILAFKGVIIKLIHDESFFPVYLLVFLIWRFS